MKKTKTHLIEAGETYWQHMYFAFSVAFVMIVHGIFPSVWEWKATGMMERREVFRAESLRRRRDEL